MNSIAKLIEFVINNLANLSPVEKISEALIIRFLFSNNLTEIYNYATSVKKIIPNTCMYVKTRMNTLSICINIFSSPFLIILVMNAFPKRNS